MPDVKDADATQPTAWPAGSQAPEPTEPPIWKCPKCDATEAGDWSQCAGDCPIAASPHYVVGTGEWFGIPEYQGRKET